MQNSNINIFNIIDGGCPKLGLPIRSFREPSPRFCLYWWSASHTGGCANTFFLLVDTEKQKDQNTERQNDRIQTRLTYNCAHLRSTKETLTIEHFRII